MDKDMFFLNFSDGSENSNIVWSTNSAKYQVRAIRRF
jgi:hypothetical protein